MSKLADVIVITWAKDDGMEPTGRRVWRDGCHRAEFKPCLVPRAIVWSRDMKRLKDGKVWAKENGYNVRILPDTDDVLDVARRMELDKPQRRGIVHA